MIHPAIDQFLAEFMGRFFFVFGIVGFAVGVGLIGNPVRMHQFFGTMNHWVSMRRSTKWLARPRDAGSVVQDFCRVIGGVFILVAAYSTFILITQVDVNRIVAILRLDAPPSFVAWIIESARWFLIAGGVGAILVGIMLIFFRDGLRMIETHANHWYSLRRHGQSGDAMHMGFDRWIEGYPRTMGWIITVAALVVVVDFGIRLFSRS